MIRTPASQSTFIVDKTSRCPARVDCEVQIALWTKSHDIGHNVQAMNDRHVDGDRQYMI